jgi:hypothetical protein
MFMKRAEKRGLLRRPGTGTQEELESTCIKANG